MKIVEEFSGKFKHRKEFEFFMEYCLGKGWGNKAIVGSHIAFNEKLGTKIDGFDSISYGANIFVEAYKSRLMSSKELLYIRNSIIKESCKKSFLILEKVYGI